MFNIFYLVEGAWVADKNNPFEGPRKRLAELLRSGKKGTGALWKIRHV